MSFFRQNHFPPAPSLGGAAAAAAAAVPDEAVVEREGNRQHQTALDSGYPFAEADNVHVPMTPAPGRQTRKMKKEGGEHSEQS